MSYTTVLAIYPGERFEAMEELRNAWLSAPLVWDAIWNRYGEKRHEYDSVMMAGDRLWALTSDPRLSESERAVFLMTCDRGYVLKANFAKAAEHIGEFMAEHNVAGHWVRIRDIYLSDPDVPAIGLHCTSVSENPFEGPWDDETGECDSLDWSSAWSVYEDTPAEIAA